MVRVMKSPNMISTTGRRPVIAAPTPTPVNPASEIGVSTTRDVPNSSTRPDSTLNGVPASATSSPMMKTRGSRRISSASASRTASPNVNSRTATATSGIYVLLHFVDVRIRRRHGKLNGLLDLSFHFRLNLVEAGTVGDVLREDRVGNHLDGIAL